MTVEQSDVYKANYRNEKIKSCLLDYDDLIQLFTDLEERVSEALELEIKELQQTTKLSDEEFQKDIKKLKTHFKLSIQVIGEKPGEQIVWRSSSAFEKQKFPHNVKWITYENHTNLKNNLNYLPRNTFDIRFDFNLPEILNFSEPLSETPNTSNYVIYGSSDSWVTGVEGKVLNFIEARSKKRNWVHTKYIYTLLLFLFILPTTFWAIFRIDKYILSVSANMSAVLTVGVYVYIFFLLLSLFRIMFNYFRWLFPLVEFERKKRSRIKAQRFVFSVIILGLVGRLIYDFLKFILRF